MKKKSVALVLALALVVVCIVGGTLAWLTDKTDPVVNTFTTSDISITLTESDNLNLQMIPGYTITKDPKVTVKAGSEKCYLFVKLEKSANFDTFMKYSMAAGWTQGDGTSIPLYVWYRTVDSSTSDQEFTVIANNQVTVKDTVTKADMNGLETTSLPTLTVTAYASQYVKNNIGNNDAQKYFTPAEAWDKVKQ